MIGLPTILLAFAAAGAAIPPVAPMISYSTIGHLPDKAMDLAFMHNQEVWVVEATGLSPAGSLPSSLRRAVARLEHDDWRERDRASRAIRAIVNEGGPDAARLVMRASLIRVPGSRETWLRCHTILRLLTTCDNCHGSGQTEVAWGMISCSACKATGAYWPLENYLD